jgi:pimeloyl-ACP methyl ester carboxylesterase
MRRIHGLSILFTIMALTFLGTSFSKAQEPARQNQMGGRPGGPDGPGGGMGMGGPMGQNAPLDPSIKRTYVPIAGGAYLYEPIAPGEKSKVAVLVMHSDGNYMNFSACSELSKRGYRVFCVNRSSPGTLDQVIVNARQAMAYLRKASGVEKIVLLGHSGGTTLMTSYQMIAEGGVKSCQGAEKLHKCPANMADIPPADGVMLIDPNWGNAEMSLFSVDPAIIDDDNGMNINPDLDLFNPKNGFNPQGNSDYSQDFIHKWQRAVARREQDLTHKALNRVAAVEAGKGKFSDDEPFIVAGINQTSNKLFAQDTKLMSHTAKPRPLLHAGGTITTEIVSTVRRPRNLTSTTPSLARGGEETTVRNFLNDHAIRVSDDFGYDEDSVHGIDWTSTYSSPPGNVKSISAPLLVMGMTGSWEFLASETIFENAVSNDKSVAFVEGASHMYTVCKECEKTPGQFGDTQKTTYDYIDQWLSKKGRFESGK